MTQLNKIARAEARVIRRYNAMMQLRAVWTKTWDAGAEDAYFASHPGVERAVRVLELRQNQAGVVR